MDRNACAAVRVGGRATCVTALRNYGVFAYDSSVPHIHLERDASRMRSPRSIRQPLTKTNRLGAILHWTPLIDPTSATDHLVGLPDALAQAIVCQRSEHAIASLDNALHQKLIDGDAVAAIFDSLPAKYRWMPSRLNPLAEAGQESVLRLIVEDAGLDYEIQVEIDDLGRVDLLVAGVLVLEADSRSHHDGWEAQVRDRRRDLIAAQHGYGSLRPAYQHTMKNPVLVRDAVLGLVAALRA